MIEPFNMKFRNQYRNAFELYVMGYWQNAKTEFRKAMNMLKDYNYDPRSGKMIYDVKDQLSENILEYMESLKYKPPMNWRGYKPFDE